MRASTVRGGLSKHSKFTMRLVEMLISWYTKKIFGCGVQGPRSAWWGLIMISGSDLHHPRALKH